MQSAKWLNEFELRKELFELKFEVGAPQDCWLWEAAKISRGHGIFNLGELAPKGSKAAYVAAWFFYVEPSLDFSGNFRFSHLCGEPSCVNPAHLIKLGPNGLENDGTVLEFIANRKPSIHKELLKVVATLSKSRD